MTPAARIVGWHRLAGGGVMQERIIDREGAQPFRDDLHAARWGDSTPVHRTYPTGYDPRCGWCYLNTGHTEDAHAASLIAYERGKEPRAAVK